MKIITFFNFITKINLDLKVMNYGYGSFNRFFTNCYLLFLLCGKDPDQGPGKGHRENPRGNKQNDLALPGFDEKGEYNNIENR